MKEQIITKIISRTMDYINVEQANIIKGIIEEELYHYELQQVTTALVPIEGIPEKILLYLASKKLDGASVNTLKSYKLQLMRFAKFVRKDIESINTMDIRVYLAACSKEKIKNSTMATIISTLKSFFTWLENEEYIAKSPMRKIKTTKVEKYIRKALTLEELEMVRDACENERERALIEFFYSTGCRLDEVQKLNKSDINWNTSSVVVFGKGKKEREVYLNAKAKIYLWKYLNTRTDNNEALFVGERSPHGRLGRRAIEVTFSTLGKRAGIIKPVYPHLVRHTTATSMLQNGASLSEVQNYLGHESPSTTQIYAHLNKEEIKMSHKKHLA
jgi:integrase/recombinase XerD